VKQQTGKRSDSLKAPLIIANSVTTLQEAFSSGSAPMADNSFRTLSKRFFKLVNPLPHFQIKWQSLDKKLVNNYGKNAWKIIKIQ
jgi:hypothetical protein